MKKTKEEILKAQFADGEWEEIMLYMNSDITPSILRAMQEYSDQDKQRWIKTTSPETMPPYFEHVIAFGGEVHCRLFSKAWVALQPEEFVERTGISHWMPLPQPPKQ